MTPEKNSSTPKSIRTKDPNNHSDTETGTLSNQLRRDDTNHDFDEEYDDNDADTNKDDVSDED